MSDDPPSKIGQPESSPSHSEVPPTLAIDYGTRRWGLAFADELGVPVPLPAAVEPRKAQRWAHLRDLIREREVEQLIVGLPLHLDGRVSPMAEEAHAFAREAAGRFDLPVSLIDERHSSQQAAADSRTARLEPDDRKSGTLDSRAATLILQAYLEG